MAKLFLGNRQVTPAFVTRSTSAITESLEVIPSGTQQEFEAPTGIDGFTPVTVQAVTASVDPNIVSSNIKNGVTILGVEGSYGNLPTIESLTINPSTSSQTINVSPGIDGYGPITVNPVTSSIDSDIVPSNIKNGVTILGVTGNYVAGSHYGLVLDNFTNEVDSSGVLQAPASCAPVFTGVKDIVGSGLRRRFSDHYSITSISFPDLENISGEYACYYFCNGAYVGSAYYPKLKTISGTYSLSNGFSSSRITSVSMPELTTVSGDYSMMSCFSSASYGGYSGFTSFSLPKLETISGVSGCNGICNSCYYIMSIDLPKLKTVSGASALSSAFQYGYSLTEVSFPELITISGSSACYRIFYTCYSSSSTYSSYGLHTVRFPKLSAITGNSAFSQAFYSDQKLENIYFNALTTSSFGSYTNQFQNMFNPSTGQVPGTCTVHFPSNLSSTISGLTGYPLFGGTSGRIVLSFDLPATS